MERVQSHRDLVVWQKAMELVVMVFRLTARFPKTETYGMVAQLTRAVTSVPANVAEGNARGSRKDYANFIAVARGSLMETETLLILAIRLEYTAPAEAQPALSLVVEISKMLTALRSRLLQGTRNREQGIGNREQGIGNRE